MKKIVFVITILLLTVSCNKNSETYQTKNTRNEITTENVVSILKTYHKGNSKIPILDKIKKWIKAHVGTHIPVVTCYNSYPCGPCPGFCLRFSVNSSVVNDNYTLSESELQNGERLFIMSEYDSINYIITFINTDDFVYNDTLRIDQDMDLGQDVAQAFGKQNFVISKGMYPVIYDYDSRGETVISINN